MNALRSAAEDCRNGIAPPRESMASSHTLQAATRFAWHACVPAGGKCTWDTFFAMARKLFLALTLRANGIVNPADALQAVRDSWARFGSVKAYLSFTDFERFWWSQLADHQVQDDANWVLSMVHRIIEPQHRAQDSLTLWRWREDAAIFAVANPARGAVRFDVPDVKQLLLGCEAPDQNDMPKPKLKAYVPAGSDERDVATGAGNATQLRPLGAPKRPRHVSHVLDSFTRTHWHTIFSDPQRRERLLMAEATEAFVAGQAAAEAGGDGVLAAAICTPGQVLQAPWDLPPVRRRRRSKGPAAQGLSHSSSEPSLTLAQGRGQGQSQSQGKGRGQGRTRRDRARSEASLPSLGSWPKRGAPPRGSLAAPASAAAAPAAAAAAPHSCRTAALAALATTPPPRHRTKARTAELPQLTPLGRCASTSLHTNPSPNPAVHLNRGPQHSPRAWA